MSAAALGCLLLAGFFTLHLAAPAIPARWRKISWIVFAAALAFAAVEYTRFDHGHPDWSLWIGFVGAPVLVIFGGAAEGARRWYGWPDLGPVPGRLAAVAAAVLVGVLVGTQITPSDVELTRERGERLRTAIRAYRDAHDGRWPATLEEAVPSTPTTRMGGFDSPPFRYDAAAHELRFPLGTDREVRNDLAAPKSAWERVRK